MTQWSDIQQTICRKCIDGDGHGACRLPVDESCPLKQNFSLIVTAIGASEARDYDAYVGTLRSFVCQRCGYQEETGTCDKRNKLECALDRYYPLVIDIIEHQNAVNA
jgi:hypothetical protein